MQVVDSNMEYRQCGASLGIGVSLAFHQLAKAVAAGTPVWGTSEVGDHGGRITSGRGTWDSITASQPIGTRTQDCEPLTVFKPRTVSRRMEWASQAPGSADSKGESASLTLTISRQGSGIWHQDRPGNQILDSVTSRWELHSYRSRHEHAKMSAVSDTR